MSQRHHARFAGLLVSALVIGAAALTGGSASAAPDPQPSDGRATMVPGNVVTCAQAGFPNAIQVGSSSNTNASDAFVSGTVTTNSGTTQPGVGQELDVTIQSGIAVDGVIVKGGPAWNKYFSASVLPPTLPSPQHYISPLNPGGNVPTISHWFVCYHLTDVPSGSLVVSKSVGAPNGTPLAPLPTSFTAHVTCTEPPVAESTGDATAQSPVGLVLQADVTFGASGGIGTPNPVFTDLPIGTVCTVVEQNTASFPTGTTTGYLPTGANTTGVTIDDSEVGVLVTITNDFSGISVAPEDVVRPAEPVAVAPAFTG